MRPDFSSPASRCKFATHVFPSTPIISGYQHRALVQSNILEPVVVMSVQTCRRIFPFEFFFRFLSFFFFLLYLQTFYLLLLNNPYPFLSEFQENELGTTSFWKVLFFFCFPSILIAKKGTCYHFIDDVRFRVCAEAGLKDSFFFVAPKVLSLAHDCDQVERKCHQQNGARARSEKFCDWHSKDFSSPGEVSF